MTAVWIYCVFVCWVSLAPRCRFSGQRTENGKTRTFEVWSRIGRKERKLRLNKVNCKHLERTRVLWWWRTDTAFGYRLFNAAASVYWGIPQRPWRIKMCLPMPMVFYCTRVACYHYALRRRGKLRGEECANRSLPLARLSCNAARGEKIPLATEQQGRGCAQRNSRLLIYIKIHRVNV